jgi:hypothetical protein
MKVAQLRFDQDSGEWTLYCRDRNERWFEYYDFEPTGLRPHPEGDRSGSDRDLLGLT